MAALLRFQMSEQLIFGNGAAAELPLLLQKRNKCKPLIITDPGVVKAGICGTVQRLLEQASISVVCFDSVEADPRMEITADCLKAAKSGSFDVFIGLGGGSALDIAKVCSILMTNPGPVEEYIGIDKIPQRGLDTILIPTTAGTGSEVTPIAVLSDKKNHLKMGIVSDKLYASAALIDPELMLTLPPSVTAYTGMDALTHAIEAYTNKFAQPFIDTFALAAIRLIGSHLRQSVRQGRDLSARYSMALASLYGGLCLGSVNTAGVHALAYPLGGTYDVPHGVANSLLLPYVMGFNLSAMPRKYADVATALGEDTGGLGESEAAALSVKAVVQLSKDIGIVSRLRDLKIPENAVADMARNAIKVTRLLNNNPRPITEADAREIYACAY